MGYRDADSDIVALHTALSTCGVQTTREHIAVLIDRPFLLVGSEEWLDRATIPLFPRMHTVLPDNLLAFRLLQYNQLRDLGVRVTGTWCQDSTTVADTLKASAEKSSIGIIVWNTDGPLPVLQRLGTTWMTVHAPTGTWNTSVAGASSSNGYYVFFLEHGEIPAIDGLRERIRRARDLLLSSEVFRFPTPNHPLRVYQAWHTGISSLAVISYAAREAAPLSIVSDTVALVFDRFCDRAQQALLVVNGWEAADVSRQVHAPLYADIRSKYLDIVYLFELICTQFPRNGPMRALSRAEGALIAEVCADARLVYGEIAEVLEMLEKKCNVVGRPGFEPGTKSL